MIIAGGVKMIKSGDKKHMPYVVVDGMETLQEAICLALIKAIKEVNDA